MTGQCKILFTNWYQAFKKGDSEGRKLFVGGLNWNTTQETLRNYFTQYGEVVDCVVMKDKATNQSRGFGFVKFKDPNSVVTVLANRPHTLDGRNIDPKPCTPRGTQAEKTRPQEGWKGPRSDSKSKKIFVGGIPHNCGETELREYFKKFGVVTEVVMIYDAEKQRPRGFGFISYEDEQSMDQAVDMHFHDIMGKEVYSCNFILPSIKTNDSGMWVPAGQGNGKLVVVTMQHLISQRKKMGEMRKIYTLILMLDQYC
ncbi:DAZ-associated protein 1-like [Tachyglossus aculeatus]|uniref:DAZ-associated protein 1-like n=1 Tax=Tachyglossus aculeatus TaxID=9261 RepID=UPI0018F3103C|nr:DAZ-associated protein 1-like [Tachyglossus aculeatus]